MLAHPDQPAFPVQGDISGKGMTLREYFSLMVLQGILAGGSTMGPEEAAKKATDYADQLFVTLMSKKRPM